MPDIPTEAEFRAAGYTANAIKYPLSDGAVAYLCKFNGAPDGWIPPRAWRYAPNAACQTMLERNAAALVGVKLGDVPLSTGTGQVRAPEINGDLGTAPQQTEYEWHGDSAEPKRWVASDGTIVYRSYADYCD